MSAMSVAVVAEKRDQAKAASEALALAIHACLRLIGVPTIESAPDLGR